MQDIVFDKDRLAWLALASFPSFGSRTLAKLKQHYGLRAAALRVPLKELQQMGHEADVLHKFTEFRRAFDQDKAVAELDRDDIHFVLIDDDEYPPLLRQISDPPQALFVRGTLPQEKTANIAIVGTRSCTSYGRMVTHGIAYDLSRVGCTIVSGLALGIDTVAHEAALEANGTCIAVLGTGIDDASLYPRANAQLAQRIIANGGAVISELPPGTGSFKFHFPLRNRIIAGLARATVVTEAALKSGSLITAHLALSYNREVLAVPGPITGIQSMGTNKLIGLGAALCTSAQDVLATIHTNVSAPVPQLRIDDLDPESQQILHALDEPQRIDDLARALKTDIQTLQQKITSLELQGFIEIQPGQRIAQSRFVSASMD